MSPTPTQVLQAGAAELLYFVARQAQEAASTHSPTTTATGSIEPTPTPTMASLSPTGSSATFNSQASASSAMASLSAVVASASAALASESAIAAGKESNPPYFKNIGIGMAILSGFFIGSSFVLKKKGLLASQKKYATTAGEGMQYLKSFLWWSGMIIMILGEVLNLVAYSFTDAILVTPMGALSVVVCAILSSFFLQEKLSLFGWLGCGLCILGSTIIALNGPEQHASGQILEFQALFLAPGFLAWTGVCIVAALALIFFVVPKYGKKNMLVHISICSVIGGLSVSVTSGLGSAILLSIRGQNQFKHWFIYFLLAFVVVTLLTEIVYLNKALELFNTAMVTPTYYVLFTFMTLVTSIVLFQGLHASAIAIITIVLGFLTICIGITILQLSKIDPEELAKKPGIDRSTTMLLKASRSHISHPEKGETTQIEEPGVDTVRGGLGIVGSVIRARSSRRASRRFASSADEYRTADELGALRGVGEDVERYRLEDGPVPRSAGAERSAHDRGVRTMPVKRDTTISWASGTEGHDRDGGRPAAPLSPGLANSETMQSIDLTSAAMGQSSSTAADTSAASGNASNSNIPQRRVYATEPRNGNAFLSVVETNGTPASVAVSSHKYLDPYSLASKYGGEDGLAGMQRPGLPSSPTGDIRTMWDLQPVQTLSTSASDDSERQLGRDAGDTTARTGRDTLPSGEEAELLSPRPIDSEDEEERDKAEPSNHKRSRVPFFKK